MYTHESRKARKRSRRTRALEVNQVEPLSGVLPREAEAANPVSDEPLMDAVRQGDERAFEILMNKYKNPITNYIHRIVQERERARDLTQETFLKVFRFAGRYRPGASFSTWLYRIATNVSIEELRRRKRWSARFVDFGRPETHEQVLANARESGPGPKAILLREETAARVRTALYSLPPRYRFPVVLRDLQGLSYQEVADVTRLPLNTVKTRLNRGRLLLKEKLRPFVEGTA